MGLTILSALVWFGFNNYQSEQKNIYMLQFIPPYMIVSSLNLIGVYFSIKMKKHIFKYILITIQSIIAFYFFYSTFLIIKLSDGDVIEILRQISY